jgi:YidC/Oxa1 family membrane protein insertase
MSPVARGRIRPGAAAPVRRPVADAGVEGNPMSGGMSTERRALIAFVASMALFFAYDAIFLAPKMKEQRARRAAIAEQQAAEDATSRADSIAVPARPRATDAALTAPAPSDTAGHAVAVELGDPDAAPATITVASPFYELTFSNRGGVITSARLRHYETRGKPVELLPAESWSGVGMLSATVDGESRDLDLGEVMFEASAGGKTLADGARVEVSGDGPTELVFRAAGSGGATVERTYRFFGDRYDFESRLRVSESLVPGASNVSWSFGPGLTSTEENVSTDEGSFRASVLLGEERHRRKPGDFGRSHVERYSGTLNWASLQTRYFMAAMFPFQPVRADVEVTGIKADHRITETVTIPAETGRGDVTSAMRVFLGPLDFKIVETLGIGLEKNIEMGMKFIRPVSVAVLWLLQVVHRVIPNYGLVIIVVSLLTKILFYRLTHKSFKSMKEMQDLQPRLQALKEKFGDDRKRLSEETMRLYKEAGVNPLGGCLPMVLQMPVFIALFNVLNYTIELRGAPFVGWINDLSQQDVLFKLPISLPFIGDNFSLLPILMGFAMWAQSKLGGSPTGQSSTAIPPGFNTMLPIIFTVLFYKMPSGLVIYWIINTVMSVAQQYYIVKNSPKPTDEVAVVEAPRKTRRAGARKGR